MTRESGMMTATTIINLGEENEPEAEVEASREGPFAVLVELWFAVVVVVVQEEPQQIDESRTMATISTTMIKV